MPFRMDPMAGLCLAAISTYGISHIRNAIEVVELGIYGATPAVTAYFNACSISLETLQIHAGWVSASISFPITKV